jgi:predicted phage terminase large subunit-like protein
VSDRNLLLHAAREDFMTFARLAFAAIRPGVQFERNWHLNGIAQMLMEAELSREVRQIVTIPPRSLKTFLITEAFPAWLLGRNPATRIICVTYGETLSRDQATNTERIMQSPFYRKVFPGTRIASCAKLKLTTTEGGMRFATSVGGPTTGFGGDWVIVDDPMNATDAHSQTARESVKSYFDRALSTRVTDETTPKFIIVMQRLHEDDLAGHLLSKGGWNELRLQAKATETVRIDTGGRDMHEFKAGQLLHEKRLPQHVLDRKLREVGSITFEAQYQQNPVPTDGNIVRREWLKYYSGPVSRDDAQTVLSLDTATKTNPEHDYSVCTVWAYKPGGHYLLDLWRTKLEYPQLKPQLIDLYHRHGGDHLLIEDQGNGAALVQELKSLGFPAVGRTPQKDKATRLISSTSYIESGQMLLPSGASWLAEFEAELLGFPNAKHDDQVDSLTQYFAWVRERGNGGFLVHNLYDEIETDPETLADVLAALPRW